MAPSTPSPLTVPTLCHPHLHLDKAYLLTSHTSSDPDYSDLGLESGSFSEALQKTSEAKKRYTVDDLVLRGSQLLAESIRYGVTSVRAFVEIDHVTQLRCLEAAVALKTRFAKRCYVQICVFAQDPIMSGDHGADNMQVLKRALNDERYRDQIDVLGSTPYVEDDDEAGIQNIRWAIDTAIERNLHLDFHLDYNLDPTSKPLIWDVLDLLHKRNWTTKTNNSSTNTIVIGHCTRLTTFSTTDLTLLSEKASDLPVSFVGLPTSDLFMMGRPDKDTPHPFRRDRGTLQVLELIKYHDIAACIGVNNVGNAFTPWGSADPLALASLGVGLYQAGTAEDAGLLFECVSGRAERAIGLDGSREKGRRKQVMEIENEEEMTVDGVGGAVPARQRTTVQDLVWDPPDWRLRRVRDA